MNLTIPKRIADTNRHLSLYNAFTLKGFLFLSLVIASFFSTAQSVYPSIINISGQSAKSGNFRLDWSIGESASITTMSNSNLIVTTGVLQSYAALQTDSNTVGTWTPGEIRIYPNPTKDIIEINILHKLTGRIKLELMDASGRKVMEKQFQYYGTGRIEKWDLSKLPAAEYFLYIQQFSPVTLRPIKKGAFKIQKIQ